jgi:hypothetical protein
LVEFPKLRYTLSNQERDQYGKSDPLPLVWSLRTEGRVHRVVPDGKDDVTTPETGVPGVDLSAEERNGR